MLRRMLPCVDTPRRNAGTPVRTPGSAGAGAECTPRRIPRIRRHASDIARILLIADM